MSKRASMPSAHDVARLAGVSQAAVSRAFTPGASIATATRERVLEAAKTLDYRPNLLARSLIKGQSGIVGVVIGDARYPFFLAALAALSARLSQANKHILVYTANGDTAIDPLVEDLLNFRVDAILMMAADLSPELADKCRRQNIQVMAFNRPIHDGPGFAGVIGDNATGGAALARHLLEQGYRDLAVIPGLPHSPASQEREAGFTDFLAGAGLPPPRREPGYFHRDGAREATRKLLSSDAPPDAIFGINDDMALAALEVARFEFGLTLGRDIGVAGFDDSELAAWPSFDLTTYSLPIDAVTESIMTLLLRDPDADVARTLIVEGELKARGSTRRA